MVTPNTQSGASLNPDDLGQGGLFDAVLTIVGGKFEHHQFQVDGQQQKGFQARLNLQREDGNVSEWSWSVGAGEGWNPSSDGMEAVPVRDGGKIAASSAFGIFLKELVNAGFPANRLTSRLDSLFGTQFLSYSHTPQNRDGSERKAILAAKSVVGLPGEVNTAATAGVATPPVPPTPSTPAAPPVPPSTNGTVDLGGMALKSAQQLGGEYTLQQVMARCMSDYAQDSHRDDIAGYVFNPEFVQVLTSAGFNVAGNKVSK